MAFFLHGLGTPFAHAQNVGYRDFSYGTTGDAKLTGERPESKLWWNDGSWWGSLFDPVTLTYHVYRLDTATQTWIDTGTALDNRSRSKADALWDGSAGKLYVVSHLFSSAAQPSATVSDWARLYRLSYNMTTKAYTLDSGFPVTVTEGVEQAVTLAKDSQGILWVTYVESNRVMINHSTTDDLTWSTPEVLPVGAAAEGLASNDISAVIAFQGNKIGVMWSNQVNGVFSFAVHNDKDPAATWQAPETPLGGPASFCAGLCAAPDINLKASSTGQVFAAVLTAMTTPVDAPRALLLVRGAAGGWSGNVFGSVFDNHNHPIVELDEEAGQVYVFASPGASGGVVYEKSSPINGIQFMTGLGQPFISSSTDTSIDHAASTKQNLDSTKGLTVLASDQNTDFYLHNNVPLVARAPSISSLTPTSGLAGSSVQLSGSSFTGATAVTFNGTPATFTVDSAALIAAIVPLGASTGKVSVTTPTGTAFSSAPFTVESSALPAVSSFSPTRAWVGTAITVSGTNFTGTLSVAFNGAPGAFTVNSDTQITVVVPPEATSGPIAVTNTLGTAASSSSFAVQPVIRSFSPTTGPMGTMVTINGTGFSGATRVSINDDPPAAFTIVSGNLILATVPGGCTSGTVKVTTPQTGAVTTTNFTVTSTAPPVISSFSPVSGPVGAYINLYGVNFTGTTAVSYNGTPVASSSFEGISDTMLETIVPAGATSGPIKVTNTAGSVTSSTNFTVNNALPLITSFSPASGPAGTAVIIKGINFTGATAVTFNWKLATFTVASATQINTSVPAGATSGLIRVVTPQGTAATGNSFAVSSTTAPTIISFSPTSATIGSTVTITGAGFTGATGAAFHGTAATSFWRISDTLLSAIVPPGATSGPISVTNTAGTATSSGSFTVKPGIISFSPASGPAGASVSITGTSFIGVTAVIFNGAPATFTVVSSTQISAVAPAAATTGPIKVTCAPWTAATSTSFVVMPQVTGFSPTSGAIGAAVTLAGSGLNGATAVYFDPTASFNGTPPRFP